MTKEAGHNFVAKLSETYSLNTGEVSMTSDHNLLGASHIASVAGAEYPTVNFMNGVDFLVTKTYKNLLSTLLHLEDLDEFQSLAICGLYPMEESLEEGMHSAFR